MDAATMGLWFDLLQDKYGSPYFTDAEKSIFLQRAQIEFVDELFRGDNETNGPNIELSQDTISKIAPLIYELPYKNMSSVGVITKATLGTELDTQASGSVLTASNILWRPLSIGLELGSVKTKVTYLRHNDRWEFEKNYFKRPTLKAPKVRETALSYIFAPVNTTAKIHFTVLKYPEPVNIPATTVNSDLPDHTHNRIVAIALEFAGIGSRDNNLVQLVQAQQNA